MRDQRPELPQPRSAEHWMRIALRLAGKGKGVTSPNPMVGAVVVSPSGEVVGSGWHRGPGEPHAEAAALTEASERAQGSVLYVNLEPCAHHGRTPPCTEALLRSGVSKVVFAIEDPDARVAGEGARILREGGVQVVPGVGEREAAELNREYLMHRLHNRPYVTLKMAASLDGRTSAADGSSRWITGEQARLDVHRLRARSDAVCVGIGTVIADDPSLTARMKKRGRQPCRVVVDSMARTPLASKVLHGGSPVLIFTSARAPADRRKALNGAGAEVVAVPSESREVPVAEMLEQLADRSILSLLLEGGPTLAGSFASAGLIDRYLIYLAPKLLGGPLTGSVISGWQAASIGEARPLNVSSVRRLGDDIRVEAFPADKAKMRAVQGRSEARRRLARQ